MIGDWHPVGFWKDRFASSGWGSLREAITLKSITFEELVARYNALLLDTQVDDENEKKRERES